MGSQPVARTPAKKLAPEADLREQWAAITAMGVRTEPARSVTINAPATLPTDSYATYQNPVGRRGDPWLIPFKGTDDAPYRGKSRQLTKALAAN